MRRISVGVAAMMVMAAMALGQVADKPKDPAAGQTNVPVKVVVLFSSGVGYFEHAGGITGNASTELRFKTQQINDILKSLILQDMGGGKVTTVVYPSQDPIEKTLKSFQVDITGEPPLAEMLSQLRGAKLAVTTASGEIAAGTILNVEKRQKPVGEKLVADIWVVNLISGAMIRSIELTDAKKIELQDPQLQEELTKALSALAQARDQDKKPVTIQFAGEGERQVRIGYVVETPVWKTSYRLIMPGMGADAKDKPKLVGWAIVENQTDNDWTNIQLNLVSGRPISFIQDLYRPLYIPRPVVQPELFASLIPQTYEAGFLSDRKKLADAKSDEDGLASNRAGDSLKRAERRAGVAASPPPAAAKPAPGWAGTSGMAEEQSYRRMDNAAGSIQSVASAAKVGELFQYTVGNVNLPRQRSAMIPIITDDIEVEKVSIYNPAVLPRNPLTGARIKNITGKHLLAGPVTVLDGAAYAGDAKIDNVPPTQERLLSYGVDLQVLVDAKNNKQESAITAGKIVKGVLWVTHKHQVSQDYNIQNKGDAEKTVIIEHAFHSGWTLVEPAKAPEKTDQHYRFRQSVKPGATATLTVLEENINVQQQMIVSMDSPTLEMYARTGKIPQAVREVLTQAIKLKNAVTDTQRTMDQQQRQIQLITQEQVRIRENLKTVGQTGEYGNRLLKKLADQETTIEKLQGEVAALQIKVSQQREQFENYLSTTSIE